MSVATRRTSTGDALRRSELERVKGELAQVDEDLRALRDRRSRLASEAERLTKRLNEPRSELISQDTLLVRNEDLAPYVQDFYDSIGWGAGRLLAHRAGVSDKLVYRILGRQTERSMTTLSAADRIMIALDRQAELARIPLHRRRGSGSKVYYERVKEYQDRREDELKRLAGY